MSKSSSHRKKIFEIHVENGAGRGAFGLIKVPVSRPGGPFGIGFCHMSATWLPSWGPCGEL